jgi:Aerotolerance regulator N-terminal
MNGLTFLNSPLLWGLSLAAVPILIHLLFRRRFRRIEWAPMRYLKLSIQKNRRRFRFEQMLLLLLRTLIVLLLFFLLARPVMHAEGLGSWLGGRSRTSQLLILDDSLSMGAKEGGRSAFDRARELALEIVGAVGPQDRFTLVLSSQSRTPLLREVELLDPDETRQLINGLAVSDAYTSWKSTLDSADELITSGTFPIREVTLITDLRRAGWSDEIAELADRWSGSQVRLRIFDVGSDKTESVSLVDLRQVDRVSLSGAPTRWEAVIRNQTSRELEGAEASFLVDGKPNLVRLPTLPPGGTAQVPLNTLFQEAGLHHVALKLPQDDLPGDDQRFAVTKAQERLRMVLVDGEPSSEPLAGEVDFLALALSLGQGEGDSFQVEIITDSELTSINASRPDLVVLANVASLTARQADDLSRLVKDGMGLMIFVGDQVDPANYNQFLYKAGQGLLPAALETIVDEEVSGLVVEPQMQGPLDALLQLNPAVLERVRIKKWYQLAAAGEEAPVRAVARWNNAASSPAVVEKKFGAGSVLLWTVAADKQWSDWPTDPTYVLAIRESAMGIARTDGGLRNQNAGEVLRYPLPKGDAPNSATIEAPDATSPQPMVVETDRGDAQNATVGTAPGAGTGDSQSRQVLTYASTRRAGLYRLSWKDAQQQPHNDIIAVNPDARECDLERISPEQLRGLWGRLSPEVITGTSGDDGAVAIRGKEIWRSLASGMLALLLVETCFATWAGRQR